jgi:hypothetical protein
MLADGVLPKPNSLTAGYWVIGGGGICGGGGGNMPLGAAGGGGGIMTGGGGTCSHAAMCRGLAQGQAVLASSNVYRHQAGMGQGTPISLSTGAGAAAWVCSAKANPAHVPDQHMA